MDALSSKCRARSYTVIQWGSLKQASQIPAYQAYPPSGDAEPRPFAELLQIVGDGEVG